MFTYIKLKNYKSFRNVELNLCNKKGIPRNIVLLYGENGCGKSNLVNVFYTLSQFFRTMQVKDIIDDIISNRTNEIEDIESFKEFLKSNLKETEAIIKESKTINSTENMEIELGFNINGLSGSYYIETNNSQIIHEKLNFVKTKNKTNYFDIISLPNSEPKFTLNSNIILDKFFLSDTLKNIRKYAGKHSLLSILLYESKDKQASYFKSAISDNFHNVLHELFNISCLIRLNNYTQTETGGILNPIIRKLDDGIISVSKKTELLNIEKALNIYFKNIVRDFISVEYRFENTNQEGNLHYSLYLNRYIGNEIISIPFEYESSGISSLLNLLPYFLDLFQGCTVIIDEMDRGIHDILFENMLNILKDNNNGQLILTLHNTNIMENPDLRDNVYFIITNKDKTKEIKNVNDFNRRLYKSNNLKDLYFNSTYGALPIDNQLNLATIIDIIYNSNPNKLKETE